MTNSDGEFSKEEGNITVGQFSYILAFSPVAIETLIIEIKLGNCKSR